MTFEQEVSNEQKFLQTNFSDKELIFRTLADLTEAAFSKNNSENVALIKELRRRQNP